MPSISILLPVYNGLPFLIDAINSIVHQSFKEFELIIINDGSTDNSEKAIKNLDDARIKYVKQKNQGLAATLNNGIKLSQSKFIARLDQDDLMLQSRLAKQVEYIELHPDCAMVGTWCEIWVGETPTDRGHKHPTLNETLQLELLFDNPFVHSSLMIRTDVLRDIGGYSVDKSRQPPEDYELWSRVARKYRVANIPEVLTVYREVEGSMTRTEDSPILPNVIQISAENLANILIPQFSWSESYSLASLYHGGKADKNRLTKPRALLMHKKAALIVGGDITNWSDEFLVSFNKQHAHLKLQCARRYLPKFLLKTLSYFKKLLK